ncbi:uncharacterized protein Dvir_GJ27022 [Drosophila virilis]|uniref:Kinesin-like protein KIF2A-like N-terminal domain-containing protein n=1 Tax=Drosophila virilis TaxID=7244 RepID=A0A0Q9WF21_DROVI|nr:kinesin-like protein Klp10A [Drosophila virilis]KRF79317.1 uncharacterized protein Dvir_GJ27022 [Drosophila virilis]
MEYLLIGEKISISRTDGRVHTAVVDSKQDEVQSITVAWTEGSKMMGKEIPWSSIVALNPHLMERTQLWFFTLWRSSFTSNRPGKIKNFLPFILAILEK